jgi:hypothetical protein
MRWQFKNVHGASSIAARASRPASSPPSSLSIRARQELGLMRKQRLRVGSSLVPHGHKPMPQVERGRFPGRRSEAHDSEGAACLVEQPPDQRGGDAMATCAFPDVEVPEPANPILIDIGIAIEPAYAYERFSGEGTKQLFSREIEPVRAGCPVPDQPIHEEEAFIHGFGSKQLHSWVKSRCGTDAKILCHFDTMSANRLALESSSCRSVLCEIQELCD